MGIHNQLAKQEAVEVARVCPESEEFQSCAVLARSYMHTSVPLGVFLHHARHDVCGQLCVCSCVADAKDDDTEEERTQASEQRTPLGLESISVGGGCYTSNDVSIGYGTRR